MQKSHSQTNKAEVLALIEQNNRALANILSSVHSRYQFEFSSYLRQMLERATRAENMS
jgi:hypothetical protein